jgi:hypothetical protein
LRFFAPSNHLRHDAVGNLIPVLAPFWCIARIIFHGALYWQKRCADVEGFAAAEKKPNPYYTFFRNFSRKKEIQTAALPEYRSH